MSTQPSNKTAWRRQLRQQRQQLLPVQRQAAATQIVQSIFNNPLFQTSLHVAIYLPFDNEADITALCSLTTEKFFYLPIITDRLDLRFAAYVAGDPLKPNRFGINEPIHGEYYPATGLDLVCLPLVGFDTQGTRLGTGAGYYDRTFAFKQGPSWRPYLLGIAYECQKACNLPADSWDVPMWGIQTEIALYQFG